MPETTFIAQMANVWLSPVGTVAPAGPTVTPAVAWKKVGMFTPDSLSWATDPSFEQVRAHQSKYPVRQFQTQDAATVEVDLLEWTKDAFTAVFGGGTITQVAASGGNPAYTTFTPPAVGGRTRVAAMIDLADGARVWRRIIPLVEQVSGVTQSFNATAASTLPLRLSVVGSDIGDPWYDQILDSSWNS